MSIDLSLLLLGVGVASLVLVAALILWSSPRSTAAIWCLVIFLTPVWVGVNIGIFWSAAVAITVFGLGLCWSALRVTIPDLLFAAFLTLSLLLFMIGEVETPSLVTAILEWTLPYLWGRMVFAAVPASFLTRCIATCATVAAVLAITEFATGVNVFVLIPGDGIAYSTWAPLQSRGSFVRAEGAFGHSIALGAVLAMSSAFVLLSSWRAWIKTTAIVLLGVATVVTFSRIGFTTFAITVALTVVMHREIATRLRVLVVGTATIVGALAAPFLQGVFLDAGDEAGGSADYRTHLFALLSQVRLLGGASGWEELVVDDYYLGYFARSIDNTLILAMLRYGILPAGIVFAVYFTAIVLHLKRGRANPAGTAILAQAPSLLAVALITQYGIFFWFLVGLCVSWSQSSGNLISAAGEQSLVEGSEAAHERHAGRPELK